MIRATRHASRRMQQRGIRQIFLDRLLDNADVEVPIGSACTLYRVSRELATTLNADDRLARYGPPMVRPDIGIITFQGGGANKSVQASAPKRLLYRDDPYKFGTALRRYMGAVGLSDTLANRTVAQAVVFPQAPTSQAGGWMAKAGPKARWREFSKSWTERLVEAQRPKVVLVFGEKASAVLGIEWHDTERQHKQNHMTFGRADWRGIPAVFCHHLSIGCPESEAIRCMVEVKTLIDRQ